MTGQLFRITSVAGLVAVLLLGPASDRAPAEPTLTGINPLPAWALLSSPSMEGRTLHAKGADRTHIACESVAAGGQSGYRLVSAADSRQILGAAVGAPPDEAEGDALRKTAGTAVGRNWTLGDMTVRTPAPGLFLAVFPATPPGDGGRPEMEVGVTLHDRRVATLPPRAALELLAREQPPLRPEGDTKDPEAHRFLPVAPVPFWISDETSAAAMLYRYWEGQGRFRRSGVQVFGRSGEGSQKDPAEPSIDEGVREMAMGLAAAACGCSFPEAVEKFAGKHGSFVLTRLRPRRGQQPLTWEEYRSIMDAGEPALVTLQGGGLRRTFVACGYAVGAPGRFMVLQSPATPGEAAADPRRSAMLIRWDGGYGALMLLRVSPPEPL